jgi:hypothetical protein
LVQFSGWFLQKRVSKRAFSQNDFKARLPPDGL